MYKHLVNCSSFNEIVSLYRLPDCHNDLPSTCVNLKEHIFNAVHTNYEVIDRNYNWSQLAFLEAFYIKNLKPSINEGIKASRELDIFL